MPTGKCFAGASILAFAGFSLLSSSPAVAQGFFSPAVQVTAALPSGSSGLVRDFDGDGRQDVLCEGSNGTSSQLLLFRGALGGGFQAPVVSSYVNPNWAPLPEPTVLIGAADVNFDGLVDVLTSTWVCCSPLPPVPMGVRLHLQVAGGIFVHWPLTNILPAPPKTMVLDDLDGDGVIELVSAVYNGVHQIVVYQIVGSALAFQQVWSVTLTSSAEHLAAGDFNGDGLKDLAYTTSGLTGVSGVSVRVQSLGLVFGAPLNLSLVGAGGTACTGSCSWLVAGDINADGLDDLVVTGGPAAANVLGPITVRSFAAPSSGDLGAPRLADLDRDGLRELIWDRRVHRPDPAWISTVWLPAPSLQGANTLFGMADLDLDGDEDMVIHNVQTVITGPSVQFLFGFGTARNDTVLQSPCAGGLVSTVFGLSLSLGSVTAGPCSIGLSVVPGQLLLPSGPLGFVVADAAGIATINLPIPANPALAGAPFLAQWLAQGLGGPINYAGSSWVLSSLRRIVVW
jgi:hypothetical protein